MGELILQAGEDSITGSKDPKLNLLAIRVKCWASDLMTAIAGACPDIGFVAVENQPRTFSRMPAGETSGYTVTITLEGRASDEDGEDFSIDGSTSNDPMESHPDIERLWTLYGKGGDLTLDPSTKRLDWPEYVTDPKTGEKSKNPLLAADDYLRPGVILTRKSTSSQISANVMRGLGKIDEPPPWLAQRAASASAGTSRTFGTFNIVQTNGNQNWLKLRVRAQWRGNCWQIEESWVLSGKDGYNSDVYGYAP